MLYLYNLRYTPLSIYVLTLHYYAVYYPTVILYYMYVCVQLHGDVDGWYTECKLDLPPGSLERAKKSILSRTPVPVPVPVQIAPDLISFHYVSERESTLLYQILHSKRQQQQSARGSYPGHDEYITPDELYEAWPRTSSEVGHYSRPMRNKDEATRLHNALYDHIHVSDGFHC